ncbi:MAG: hypothetical protein KAJ19_11645, partial [Gammaproteobacteria bacterium]|nr:hypothetical protein [Gammaproteobacteria bacterium]
MKKLDYGLEKWKLHLAINQSVKLGLLTNRQTSDFNSWHVIVSTFDMKIFRIRFMVLSLIFVTYYGVGIKKSQQIRC